MTDIMADLGTARVEAARNGVGAVADARSSPGTSSGTAGRSRCAGRPGGGHDH
ncbi:hypothetical protein [Roseicella aquatilis]|uniref:hypothetical protein n=1 Tax=Roseicella aquatilis TaxID=2527868 RepID=UPI001404A820|nr:hypothetical protein [Roseicella aquatilis]